MTHRPEDAAAGSEPGGTELADDRELRACVICGAPSTTTASDTLRPPRDRDDLPEVLPPPLLCDEHWRAYQTDWVLLGWCVDHYGEALRRCSIHGREITPL